MRLEVLSRYDDVGASKSAEILTHEWAKRSIWLSTSVIYM